MAMMPTPTGADRYRHNASLGYKRNCQEQQHDPQMAHKGHLLASLDAQVGVRILENDSAHGLVQDPAIPPGRDEAE
jgi:hypothetical protein